jgi:probable DNA repair protein
MEAVETYLTTAGWPGERAPNSIEFQTQNRWQRVVLSVAQLDASLPKTTFDEALKILARAAQSSVFAPESQDAPIQIVGAAESAGLTSDGVWFAGADELAWPPPRHPNPLLPLHLQQALKMPGADVTADFEFAVNVTRRICASAPVVFASFARRHDDAEPSASAVFSPLPWNACLTADKLRQPEAEDIYPETEPLLDRSHVPWKEDRTAGGAEVLRDQAACPFRAFASKRLSAKTLEEIEEGLGRRDRGNIVHKVLQGFWSEVVDHQNLIAMSEQQSREVLRRHIESALQHHSAEDAWTAAFLGAESDRLENLLTGWLAVERERSPFTVSQQEQSTETQIGSLKLRLRMDRVDQTAHGKVILDYKTGKASTRDWEGDRPDQPQLPLYALSTAPLAGLGFACISAKKTSIAGLQRDEGTFFPTGDERGDKMTDPLDQRLARWREILTVLAEEFVSGEARVSPKKGLLTCRNCGLEPLCRIAETNLAVADEVDG